MNPIVQKPLLNEAATLAPTTGDIPQKFVGVSSVELLELDGGSTDRKIATACDAGAGHIQVTPTNVGFANSLRIFETILEYVVRSATRIKRARTVCTPKGQIFILSAIFWRCTLHWPLVGIQRFVP